MRRLHLTLLGGFEARLGADSPVDIASKKTRALLAYLALPTGRTHSRDKLVGLLWSDRRDEQARNSLRQALTELGKALGAVEPTPLVKLRDTLALDPTTVEVDALIFEGLAAGDATSDLQRAAELYAGDLLDGLDARDAAFEEWLTVERQRLRGLAATVLKKLLTHDIGPSAIAVAHRLLALDPLQEEGHRALMRLHAEAGETAAALRQYELCRVMLKRDLDATPSPETEALYSEIRRRPGGLTAPPPDHAEVVHNRQPHTPALSKPMIAVLPFVNMSGDPGQQYFSDGLTEDIITELTRFRDLFVIARNSSFQFRDQSVDVKHIGKTLGVEYVVEGSVRKSNTRMRVTAQLIAVATGAHLWAQHYDRDLEDIFAVQDDVTQTIVATLVGRLTASGAEKARRKPTQHLVAYDYYLQGRERLGVYDVGTAEPLIRRTIELDPNFAQAYAMLAGTYLWRFFADGKIEHLNEALIPAKKAVSLDENDARCRSTLAMIYLFMHRLDLAGMHHNKAIALNPSDVEVAVAYSTWLSRMGQTSEALEKMDIAIQRDPFPPEWYWECRQIPLLQERRYEETIRLFDHVNELQVWHLPYLAICYAHLGRIEEAKAQAAEILRLKPDFSMKWITAMEPYKNPADLEHLLDGLRKAGLPE